MKVISGILAAIGLLAAVFAVPLGVIIGATHGGLTSGGIVTGLVWWAALEMGGLLVFFIFGGLAAIKSLK